MPFVFVRLSLNQVSLKSSFYFLLRVLPAEYLNRGKESLRFWACVKLLRARWPTLCSFTYCDDVSCKNNCLTWLFVGLLSLQRHNCQTLVSKAVRGDSDASCVDKPWGDNALVIRQTVWFSKLIRLSRSARVYSLVFERGRRAAEDFAKPSSCKKSGLVLPIAVVLLFRIVLYQWTYRFCAGQKLNTVPVIVGRERCDWSFALRITRPQSFRQRLANLCLVWSGDKIAISAPQLVWR